MPLPRWIRGRPVAYLCVILTSNNTVVVLVLQLSCLVRSVTNHTIIKPGSPLITSSSPNNKSQRVVLSTNSHNGFSIISISKREPVDNLSIACNPSKFPKYLQCSKTLLLHGCTTSRCLIWIVYHLVCCT